MSRTRPLASRNSPFRNGELLPQNAIRDDKGRGDNLRAVLEGRPTILLYLPYPGSSSARDLAQRLAGLKLDIPRLKRALLLPAATRGPDVIALADLGLTVLVAQRENDAPPEAPAPIVAISDTAGRVKDTGAVSTAKVARLADRAQRALTPAGQTTGTSSLTHTAPVLMIPDVLTPEQCKRLIAYFEQGESHPSGVLDLSGSEPQWRPEPSVKSRRDLRIDDPDLTREIEQAMAAKVLPEIRKCFHYVVSHHEPFKLVRYDEGNGYFRPHRDNESADTNYRRFAMTLNLDVGDYEGGALNFPEFGPATYRPPAGGAIIFSCSLLHEATDVTRGQRHVLLGFFYNPSDGLTQASPPA